MIFAIAILAIQVAPTSSAPGVIASG